MIFVKVILALGDFMNVQCHACIGGKSIGEDIRRLDYGVQVTSEPWHGIQCICLRCVFDKKVDVFGCLLYWNLTECYQNFMYQEVSVLVLTRCRWSREHPVAFST